MTASPRRSTAARACAGRTSPCPATSRAPPSSSWPRSSCPTPRSGSTASSSPPRAPRSSRCCGRWAGTSRPGSRRPTRSPSARSWRPRRGSTGRRSTRPSCPRSSTRCRPSPSPPPSPTGTFTVTGAAELRVKESDRIAALAEGLTALGARVRELPDGLVVDGGAPAARGPRALARRPPHRDGALRGRARRRRRDRGRGRRVRGRVLPRVLRAPREGPCLTAPAGSSWWGSWDRGRAPWADSSRDGWATGFEDMDRRIEERAGRTIADDLPGRRRGGVPRDGARRGA